MAAMLVGRSSAVAPTKWSRKAGPMSVPNAASPSLTAPLDEVDGSDPVLAVGAHEIADDERAVRPADEHRPAEMQLLNDRRHVLGPELAVGVVPGLERGLGHPVAPEAGTGATILVAGEAGIGKTRLASELARRARGAGFEVLLGRSIDLVGTELPYQPFAEALRPLGKPWRAGRPAPGSQLRVFEETLALLTGRAASAPVLLVLEDLHGPIPRRSIWPSFSRTTLATGRFCCSRPTGRTSPRRPGACGGWRMGSGAPARRSLSISVRSSATS
jgi:hypothetical protein